MGNRPNIPIAAARKVLHESCHRCAVCGFGLSIELAHIIPWKNTKDHSPENLIALCATCHEMADKQHWNSKDFEVYKKEPWALRVNTAKPMSAPQKAMVDFILARDAVDMGDYERVQLVQMIAAYTGVMIADVKVIAVSPSNSSLVRVEMPKGAAERIILGFQSEDPRLISFLDDFAIPSPEAYQQKLTHGVECSPLGPAGDIKLIETARPTPTDRPPVTNTKEKGLESLIFDSMTNFGWIAGKNMVHS